MPITKSEIAESMGIATILEERGDWYGAVAVRSTLSTHLLRLEDLPASRRQLCLAGNDLLEICKGMKASGADPREMAKKISTVRDCSFLCHEIGKMLRETKK
jgi:hypothetical protein